MLTLEWSGITIAIFSMLVSVFSMLGNYTTCICFEVRTSFKVLSYMLKGFAFLMEVELSAEKFFMTVNLFGLVEFATCDLLPTGLYMFAEGYASLKRIQV